MRARLILRCELCGSPYERWPSQAIGSRFCSRRCHSAAGAVRFTAEMDAVLRAMRAQCPPAGIGPCAARLGVCEPIVRRRLRELGLAKLRAGRQRNGVGSAAA
jgi:hypothetical protein